MAKIGEGDLRWIVHEREDGTNVNNWHWTEKNCLPWMQEKLGVAFKDLKLISHSDLTLKIDCIDFVKGEASINTRKGKWFHIYELELKVKFRGTCDEEKFEGNIHFPEISFEQDDDDQEYEINYTTITNKIKSKVQDGFRSRGGMKIVQNTVASVLKEFKQIKGEYKEAKEVKALTAAAELIGKGVSIDLVEGSSSSDASTSSSSLVTPAHTSSSSSTPTTSTSIPTVTPAASAPTKSKSGTETRTFEDDFKFRARPTDIYEGLMDPRRVEAYTQSATKIEAKEGGQFEMYGGNISGRFIELDPNKKIVQQWRLSSWPNGHFSKVTMTLEDSSGGCVLRLKQEGVPLEDMPNIKQAWESNLFERMKRLFGYSFGYTPF